MAAGRVAVTPPHRCDSLSEVVDFLLDGARFQGSETRVQAFAHAAARAGALCALRASAELQQQLQRFHDPLSAKFEVTRSCTPGASAGERFMVKLVSPL
jgi:hypothetical protein